jgi:hypothetical protein
MITITADTAVTPLVVTVDAAPTADVDWQYAKFADRFRTVLRERAERAVKLGESPVIITRYEEAAAVVARAIHARNIDMVVAYHQYVLDADSPAAIETALHVLTPMVDNRKVCSVINPEYISASERVSAFFPLMEGIATSDCYAVISLAFEDLTRVEEIVVFLKQGVTEAEVLRSLLNRTPVRIGKIAL